MSSKIFENSFLKNGIHVLDFGSEAHCLFLKWQLGS